ncbi:MAG: preprotein translocase subunit SecY, partial [Chlamydiota bacterium]
MEGLKRILAISELKAKIVFTLLMLVACRIGAYIPVPGINGEAAVQLFKNATGGGQNLFQLMDVFSGGAFAQMTVIALGVMPYISASIIMQLLMALIPSLQREVKENPDQGRRKLGKWIRMLTVVLAVFQAGLYGKYAVQMNAGSPGIIVNEILDVHAFGFPWL